MAAFLGMGEMHASRPDRSFGRPDPADVARARQLIDDAARVTVLTGAGISTDSGIPDFRGPDGLWTKDPDAEKQATIGFYLGKPEVRKRAWRRRIETGIFRREPNAGHGALVELEQRGKLRLLITQNIDGLHRAAGTDPAKLAEVHGNVRSVDCVSCGDRMPFVDVLARVEAGEEDPPCTACGGILKPSVVFFGESLPERDLERAFEAAGDCDLLLAVGTSLLVYPIADAVPMALRARASLVILNGAETPFDSHAEVVLRGSISEVLPEIVGWSGFRNS